MDRNMFSSGSDCSLQRYCRLAPWQVRKVTAYIDANISASLFNRQLASVARLSRSHFCRAFRTSTGRTPREYIIGRRIQHAQQLMVSTDAPLGDIAAECGLADQSHLTRLFRRVCGESPAAWRRQHAPAWPPSQLSRRRTHQQPENSHARSICQPG